MGNQSGNCYNNGGNSEVDEITTNDPGLLKMENSSPKPIYESLEEKQAVNIEVEPVAQEETKTLYNGNIVKGLSVGGQIRNGTIEYPNGNKYEGEIMHDKASGEGNMNYANGDWYVGQFEEDKRSGWGKLVMSKGNVYKGNFKDDKFEGEGEFQFKNGNSYIGKVHTYIIY